MAAYILQVILFQLLFLLGYEILLKKETFFTWNRIYLLVTMIVSFLLPLIKIESLTLFVPAQSFSRITNELLPEIFINPSSNTLEHLPAVEISAKSGGINWWLVVYSLGLFGSILFVIKKYKNLAELFRFKIISAEKDCRIIEIPNSTIACTFYRTIFIGELITEDERRQIISHELVHVKQKHTLDLVFFEILKIIFWFNPLIYIYQNRIATLHEFIADAAVVQNTEKRNYYEQLLNSAFNTKNISFINQFFNHSLIKKRIVMLQKSKSRTIVKFKYLLLVPLMLVMLILVACSEDIFHRNLPDKINLSEKINGQTLKQIDIFELKKEKLFFNGQPIEVDNLETELKRRYGKFSQEQLDNQIVVYIQTHDLKGDRAQVDNIGVALAKFGINKYYMDKSEFANHSRNPPINRYELVVSGPAPAGLPDIFFYPEKYVDKMQEMNTTFFYNGEKISAKRAKTVLKDNKNVRIFIRFNSFYGENPVMQLED